MQNPLQTRELAAMQWSELDGAPCPIARALAVIGERWTLLVLRECFSGARRFEDFQRGLGISRTVVAARLGSLVDAGILERRVYQDRPERHEYVLTPMGRDLSDTMLVLAAWGNRHLTGDQGPLVEHTHTTCGHAFRPVVTCSECGDTVSARTIRMRRTATGTASDAAPAA
jgi:DNA-binding HxlR family transcriptional regulator